LLLGEEVELTIVTEGSEAGLVVVISFAIEASRSASAGCEVCVGADGCALAGSAVAVSAAVAGRERVGSGVRSAFVLVVLLSGGGSEPVVGAAGGEPLGSAILIAVHL